MADIDKEIQKLRGFVQLHSSTGLDIFKAANGNVYPMDFLAAAVLNRSVCLLVGFCDLLEKRNFVAAAPLLRMQLDNLLRFQGAWLVTDPHDFAMRVLSGEKISEIPDVSGNKMTDRYLVEKIAIEYPALKEVYKHTSGYVHLSEKHIFNAIKAGSSKEEMEFNMKISPTDNHVPEGIYQEAIGAFFEITGILFRYLKGWEVAKRGPSESGTPTVPPKSA